MNCSTKFFQTLVSARAENSALLLEQIIQLAAGVIGALTTLHFVIRRRGKVFAKVGAGLVINSVGLGLFAFFPCYGIVQVAVQATV